MLGPKIVSAGAQPRKRAAVGVRLLDQLVGAAAGLERAAAVGVRLPQVAGDRVDHLVRHLRPGRSVEEREWALQRGEAGANRLYVEKRCAQTSRPLTRHL